MGSHIWICCYDESGQFSHGILFRWSDYENYDEDHKPVDGKIVELQVFRETIKNDKLLRTKLHDDEIDKELKIITDYLIEYLGEEKFKLYSEGGRPPEPIRTNQPDAGDDPFSAAVTIEPKTEEEKQQECIWMSQSTAASIARYIYYYQTKLKNGG